MNHLRQVQCADLFYRNWCCDSDGDLNKDSNHKLRDWKVRLEQPETAVKINIDLLLVDPFCTNEGEFLFFLISPAIAEFSAHLSEDIK